MGAKARELAVSAELDASAGVDQLLAEPREIDVVVFFFGCHYPPARSRIYNISRHEGEQTFILPYVGMLLPIILARDSAVTDDQCGGDAGAGSREELYDVVVSLPDGEAMFYSCLAVRDQ